MTEYKFKNGHTLQVVQDRYCESPRGTFENLATMVFFGKHKDIGDEHNVELVDSYSSRYDFADNGAVYVKKVLDAAICLPVNYYEHGGCGVSLSNEYPFNCRWDSGTIGFAVVTKDAIREEYGVKRISSKLVDKAMVTLESEVRMLNDFLSGNVYQYNLLDENGNEIDSCSGFYGSDPLENGMADSIEDFFINFQNFPF